MEFLCWLKAAAFALTVALTTFLAIAIIFSVFGGVCWLGEKVANAVKNNVPNSAKIGRYGSYAVKTLGIMIAVLFIAAGVYASKRKVCVVGFKKAYVEFFNGNTKPAPTPAVPCCGADNK